MRAKREAGTIDGVHNEELDSCKMQQVLKFDRSIVIM